MHLANVVRPSTLRSRRFHCSHVVHLAFAQLKAPGLALHSDSVQKDSYGRMLVQPVPVRLVVLVGLVLVEQAEELAEDNCTGPGSSSCQTDSHLAARHPAAAVGTAGIQSVVIAEKRVVGEPVTVAAAAAVVADRQAVAAGKCLAAGFAMGSRLDSTAPSCRDWTLAVVGPAVG